MPKTELVTTSDAAVLLGVSVSTVNRCVTRGGLRPVVQGPGVRGARLFNRADVIALRDQLAGAL